MHSYILNARAGFGHGVYHAVEAVYHLNSFSDDHTNCIYVMVNFHNNNWLQGNMFLPLCAKPATLKMMRDKPYLLEKAIRQCLTRGGGSNGKLIIFMCKKSPFSSWSFECCRCGAYRLVQKKSFPVWNSRLVAAWQIGQPMHSQSANFGKFKPN